MAILWLPERGEPQVTEEVRDTIIDKLNEHGLVPVLKAGRAVINSTEHEALRHYIDLLGQDLNARSTEGGWPFRALKVGGSLAIQAYREAGYDQTIGEFALDVGYFAAELDGIPEAYFSSLFEDENLGLIIQAVLETDALQAPNPSGYYDAINIGAGCVRFYMGQALAA